jgi:glycosyltransferase involved in cell wall biosynthesis
LDSAPDGNVEVIVVANGSDISLPEIEDPRIKHIRLAEKNGNKARNAGLQTSRGRYVRFLDDDDFLYPKSAALQHEVLARSGADVSTGVIRFVNEGLEEWGYYAPGDRLDFVAEIFQQRPSTLPHAHLYKRELIAGLVWNPERRYLQDVEWSHQLLRHGEVNWLPFRENVGAWVHHGKERISTDVARSLGEKRLIMGAEIISKSIRILDADGRLDDARRRSAAKALWDYAHHGFTWSPWKWMEIARWAQALDHGSRPASKLMNHPIVKWVDPVAAELLLFPPRAALRILGIVHAP